jgi:hypothetical protein
MNLAGHIARTAARLAQHRAEGYAGRALRLAQWSAERAADRVETAAPRIATLTEAGIRLTEIGCRCMDRLVRQGLESAQGAAADGAKRLRMTARARSFAALYQAQRGALPATRRRVAHDLEATRNIVKATGGELIELARSTRGELLREPARRARPSPRKPRARTRASSPAGRRAGRRRADEHHSNN